MMTFLASSESINRTMSFISYEVSADINHDQQKGLDSWMSDEDTKMIDYYEASLKSGGGH